MTDETSFTLGSHAADISALKTDVGDMKRSLARIEATLHETKGGVRTLLAVGSIAGAVGAAIMKGFAILKGSP